MDHFYDIHELALPFRKTAKPFCAFSHALSLYLCRPTFSTVVLFLFELGTRMVTKSTIVFSDWNSIFDNFERLDNAIQGLIAADAVKITMSSVAPDAENSPRWADCNFFLPEITRAMIRNELCVDQQVAFPPLKRWELEATKLIMHSFPLPDLDIK